MKKWFAELDSALAGFLVVGMILPTVASAQTYHLTDLGAVVGPQSYAQGINNTGQVVGYWHTATDGTHAFLYDGRDSVPLSQKFADLGSLGDSNRFALSINNPGDIVGFSETTDGIRAFRYNGRDGVSSFERLTNLGALGGIHSYAFGINDDGKIVGYLRTANGMRAFLYDGRDGVPPSQILTNLGTLGGSNSFAFGINRATQITGASLIQGDAATNAFLWHDGFLINLNLLVTNIVGDGTAAWVLQEGRGINNAGQIAGWGITHGQEHAFLYTGGRDGVARLAGSDPAVQTSPSLFPSNAIIDLGVLPGGTSSFAFGINNASQVVGTSSTGSGVEHAFLWQDGVMTDLNHLLPANSGWELREARGINDRGQIVGWGVKDGQEQAFILTPETPTKASRDVFKVAMVSEAVSLDAAQSDAMSVTIISPLAFYHPSSTNGLFASPANIEIAAAASSSFGAVTRVDFYEGSTFLCSASEQPYAMTWNGVRCGEFYLSAVAYDDQGNVATSSPVRIRVEGRLPAFADAYVRESKPRVNFGSTNVLEVKAATSDNEFAYAKFDVTGYDDVNEAMVLFKFATSEWSLIRLDSCSTNWAENTITWNTKPASTGAAGDGNGGDYFNTGYQWIGVNPFVRSELAAGRRVLSVIFQEVFTSLLLSINSRETGDGPFLKIQSTNYAPAISITTPANGSWFTPGNNILISAYSFPSGAARQVQFFAGSTLLGTKTNPPFSMTWTNPSIGAYVLTARVTDMQGRLATSSVVNVAISFPPNVSLTSPANGATFISPVNIPLTAQASDDGAIAKVEFFQGPNFLGSRTSPPYSITWSNVYAGSYTFIAKATDNLGATKISSPVSVTVFDPPTITVPPETQTIPPGSPATFSVVSTGSPPLSYQWQFNGTNLVGQTGSSFTISNPTTNNLGNYSVVVSNPYGTATSSSAALVFSVIVPWGFGDYGQTNLYPWMSNNIVAVSAGIYHNLALKRDGSVRAWGANDFGQTNVPAVLTNVVSICAGGEHSLALTANKTVVGWGRNDSGQANVPASATNVMMLGAGAVHSLALRSNGTLVAWGGNNFGQTNVPAGLTNIAAISANASHNVAVRSNGTVVAWGFNGSGQTNVPAGLSNVIAVAAGFNHVLVLKRDGTVLGWGANDLGQLDVPAGLTNIAAIAAGRYYSAALKSNGTVVVWGGWPQNLPPAGLTNVMAISSCDAHSLALLTNDVNRLPTVTLTSPTNNTTLTNVSAVTITASAIDSDGWIRKVEFFAGPDFLGVVTNSQVPVTNFQFIWNNPPAGTHFLKARATDDRGESVDSAMVTLKIASAVNPLADAHVRDGTFANNNFGTSTNLEVITSNTTGTNRDAYLKFSLGNVPSVTSAKLRLWAAVSAKGSLTNTVYSVTDTNWTETGITWNNKPLRSTTGLGSNVISATTFASFDFDVTSYVKSEKAAARTTVSFCLHNPGTSTIYLKVNSKEAASNKPQLILNTTNQAPAVSLIAPTNSALFIGPANIPLSAAASDSDGTIAKVEFFSGSTLVGTRTNTPFTMTWSNVVSGTYLLNAKATDNLGASKSSVAVGVVVSVPPLVAFTSPSNDCVTLETQPVALAVNASDPDGMVAKVEFFSDGNRIGEAIAAPFSMTWSGAPPGNHVLTAKATDNQGLVSISAPLSITVLAADLDNDGDGLTNIEEWIFGTDPTVNNLPGGRTGAIQIHTPLE